MEIMNKSFFFKCYEIEFGDVKTDIFEFSFCFLPVKKYCLLYTDAHGDSVLFKNHTNLSIN